MKRMFFIAICVMLNLGAWADGRVFIADIQNGTVEVGNVALTGDQTVVLTVTPDVDYYITAADIMVTKTAGVSQAPRRVPGYTSSITVSASDVDGLGKGTYTFTLPDGYGAYVEANFRSTKSVKEGYGLTLLDNDEKTVRIDEIATPADGGKSITIPAEIDGFTVVEIASGASNGLTDVTDIYLPDTKEPLTIGEGALPLTANIHTTLPLLDDYALMASLQPNYEALKIMTTVKAPNQYWTFSSGVDCVMPEDLIANIVYMDGNTIRMRKIEEKDLKLDDNRQGVKANNGVLLYGQKDKNYDIIASPGHQKSGTKPATTDAKSYGQMNQLEPVIEAKNYAAGSYYVMKHNQFHSIKANSSKVGACKAVLRVK